MLLDEHAEPRSWEGQPQAPSLAAALHEGNRVDKLIFERLLEDPTWTGVLVGRSDADTSACVRHGLDPIDVLARNYYNGGRAPLDGPELRNVPPEVLDSLEPSLEMARLREDKKSAHADEGVRSQGQYIVVFRATVVEVTAEYALLHGDVFMPKRLVLQRRTNLKKWDVVSGLAVPNFGKLYAAEGHAWAVLHVLRINSGFRKLFELRAQAIAEREMSARGLALHAKPRSEVTVPIALLREAQGASNTSAAEQAAGLVIERTLEDGKSVFRGVVGVVGEGAKWAVVSANVFLEASYVKSKWGQLKIGDVVHGLMVPVPVGGCDWRCIHVTKVDADGRELAAQMAELEARTRAEEAEHQTKVEALSKEDHKAAIEQLKAQMAAKREEAQRKQEQEREARRARGLARGVEQVLRDDPSYDVDWPS